LGGERLEGWVQSDGKTPAKWPFADGILTVGHGDVMTDKAFGNFELHVEFNVPYMPNANVQARGNSGVYLTGNYELQVLDSYGLKMQGNDCGAIYDQITPAVNACKPPLQGQTYDVTFHKAKLDNGKVVKKARVTVIQNGIKIIDNAEISPSPGARKLPRVRMVRSCSRTTAIRFSIGIFGSSRSSEQPRDDLTNTFVVGDEPTPRKIELYEICMGALAAGEALLRPDVPAAQIDAAVRGHFAANGFDGHFPTHSGHGLGLGHPEPPYLVPESIETLQAHDVVALEPGLYLPGVGGMRFERNYLTTDCGHETLTRRQLALTPRAELPRAVIASPSG